MRINLKPVTSLMVMSLFVVQVGPNYSLEDMRAGESGGVQESGSYALEAILGGNGTTEGASDAYRAGLSFASVQMANVPPAPTFTNPDNYYNMLHLVLDDGDNPSDTTFAIAISNDNFVTTNYIKSDNTIGNTLTTSDYQDYATWGGGSGFDVIGLQPNTTYTVKVKAMQGDFTESGYGPTASAATVNPSLTMDIDVAATDIDTDPPYVTDLGQLPAGSVFTGSDKIWIDLDTNAANGAKAFIYADQSGLHSPTASYTIASMTGDLSAAAQGFGVQGDSATQAAGASLTIASPYNGSSHNIGITDTSIRDLFTATGPITSGRGSVVVKAKSATLTPSANDYQELLTIIASASF